MSNTKQVAHQTKKTRKQKLITALVKQHLDSKHKKTFSNIKYQIDTELSNIKYWNIKNIGIFYQQTKLRISWEVLGTHESYNQSSKWCLLCLIEKLAITLHKDDNMLNKRSDVISKCRHKNKYMLASYNSKG